MQIDTAIIEAGRSAFGCVCDFYRLSDTHGLKLYHEKDWRDLCYDGQKIAVDNDFAPALGDKVDVDGRFGYITEIAKIAADIVRDAFGYKSSEFGKCTFEEYKDISDNAYNLSKKFPALYLKEKELFAKIRETRNEKFKTKLSHFERDFWLDILNDAHPWNWGLVGAKPVMIDFSMGCCD